MLPPDMLGRVSERDAFWDAARGMAIIAVVWIHARDGASCVGLNFDYWVVLRDIINFPVALFFFIAGFLVNTQKLSPAGPWMKSRAVRLLIPFFIWSLVYGAISIAMDGAVDNPLVFLGQVLFGMTAGHLYFIVVLVQFTLLTPLIARVVQTRWVWCAYAVTPAYLAGMYVFAFSTGGLPPSYNYLFAGWAVFYVLGMHVKASGWRPRVSTAAALLVVTLVLAIAESYVLLELGMPSSFAVSQLKVSSVATSIAVALLVLALHRPARSSAISRLGLDSYGIYFVHMVWIIALTSLIGRVPLFDNFPVLFVIQILQVAAAILLSQGMIWVTRRVIGRPIASKYLGF